MPRSEHQNYFTRLSQIFSSLFYLDTWMKNIFITFSSRFPMLLNMAFHTGKKSIAQFTMTNCQIIKLAPGREQTKNIFFQATLTISLKKFSQLSISIIFDFNPLNFFFTLLHNFSIFLESYFNRLITLHEFLSCLILLSIVLFIAFSFTQSYYVIHKIRAGKFMNVMNSGSPFANFSAAATK